MSRERIIEYVQIVTGIAVLIGLMLVVYELRQSRQIARAEISASTWSEINELGMRLLGETPQLTLRKACLAPSELTEDDWFLASQFWSIQISRTDRLQLLADSGGYDFDVEQATRNNVRYVFGTPAGRLWLEKLLEGRFGFSPNTVAIVREVADELDWNAPFNCSEDMSNLIESAEMKFVDPIQ